MGQSAIVTIEDLETGATLSNGFIGFEILLGMTGMTHRELMCRMEDEDSENKNDEGTLRLKEASKLLKEYDLEFQKVKTNEDRSVFLKTRVLKTFQDGKWVDSTLEKVFKSRKSD